MRVRLPEIGRNVNEFFCMRDLGSKYATCVIVYLQPNGYLEYLNCGHVPPLVVRTGGIVLHLCEANAPVGLLPNAVYQIAGFHLISEDCIMLVTMGSQKPKARTVIFSATSGWRRSRQRE
jgi:phosphoserine phosphatase RsbU/P